MIREYKTPSFREGAFNCPHCNVLAKMDWYKLSASTDSIVSRQHIVKLRISGDVNVLIVKNIHYGN